MNFVFISPNFPQNYWQFCDRLAHNGVTVLGVGDAPYDELTDELKAALTEYYKVDTLEDYDAVFRAVAFFSFKYGKIDWLESNNEHWLSKDAQLRRDFNITTGVQPDELALWQSKSAMKPVYKSAGIPSARNHKVTTLEAAREFLDEVGGYPLFAKPDTGVGADDTWKIENDAQLEAFFVEKADYPYVIEEFVTGDVYSYDAISDSNGDPLFESSFICPNVAESVNNGTEVLYYVTAEVPQQLRELGRKAIKAFKVRNRFTHFEFFRLTEDRKGLGKAGDFVGLEVNMRPAGGYTPDMINFAHSTDVFKLWADMVCTDGRTLPDNGIDRYCVFASRKDAFEHSHTHNEILNKYGSRIVLCERMPDIFTAAMGNQMYTAVCDTLEEAREFATYVLDEQAPIVTPALYRTLDE
ncbi:MAG: carbamoylphosphate synthase large subunit [Mogibacterium sp.]|nr:carbamoylphosphate synthase large subunit [Mogibacterium sp.]